MNQTDLSRVDLNLLTLFEMLFEEGHAGRAAARLNLSPSAISHGLGRLRRLFNDPLFVRHPKGINPTERARALAPPVRSILEQARLVIGQSEPFDPKRSTRCFYIGALDAIAAVIVPDLLRMLQNEGSSVSIRIRQIFPQEAVAALDSGAIDVALVPPFGWPARCVATQLYVEDFVIAARKGHRLGPAPTLEDYAKASHLLVSADGSARGFVDEQLEEHGLSRSIRLTVPSFLLALAVLGETDLVCAVPRSIVTRDGARFGVTAIEPPIPFRSDPIEAVCTNAALADPALRWVVDQIEQAARLRS